MRRVSSDAVIINPRATDFASRVTQDGGIIVSLAEISESYNFIDRYDIPPTNAHWSSARFAYKTNSEGAVIKLYCLFGNDANSARGIGWLTVKNMSYGLGAFDTVNPDSVGLRDYFITPVFTWSSRILSAVVISKAYSFDYNGSQYAFTPMLESNQDWNASIGFLLSVEQGFLGIECGFSQPYNFSGHPVPPLNEMGLYTMRIDPSQVNDPTQAVVVYYNNQLLEKPTNFNNAPNEIPYATSEVYIGARGNGNGNFHWVGQLNETFFTSILLSDEAMSYFTSQPTKF